MQSRPAIRENVRMPRTPTLVPGVRKVEIPEIRQSIPALHAYLRECILDGTLTPGTKLSQVALADQLGVSRTPLREVLRMLQEEGLVEIEPKQLTVFADRTIRYIRIYQLSDPASWQSAGDAEHAAILEALVAHDDRAALSGLAHHLARTAERVLRDCAPYYPMKAVPHALELVERR